METVWIPKKHAKLGNVLKIKRDGVWDDGWIVGKIYQETDEKMLNGIRRTVNKHRQHTDVTKGTFKKPDQNAS